MMIPNMTLKFQNFNIFDNFVKICTCRLLTLIKTMMIPIAPHTQVGKKQRSNRIQALTERIRRENKVAPLPLASSSRSAPVAAARPAAAASTSSGERRTMSLADWESISYAMPTRRC